jgi:hypothetical protein
MSLPRRVTVTVGSDVEMQRGKGEPNATPGAAGERSEKGERRCQDTITSYMSRNEQEFFEKNNGSTCSDQVENSRGAGLL